jgi:2-amino-4-hydroxy-6-hydroxymethyldihydropteridine diphosphokinase
MGVYSAALPRFPFERATSRGVEQVVLGFGSNLGARAASIRAAIALLSAQPGLQVEQVSPNYETEPLGPPQPYYLNAAARVRYAGSLESLLSVTQHVEALLLRERSVRWGPRTLDIDLLSAARGAYASRRLVLPHPGLYQRAFALTPLCDVAPAWEPADGLRRTGPAAPPRAEPPVQASPSDASIELASTDLSEWLAYLPGAWVSRCVAVAADALPLPSAALPLRVVGASPAALVHALQMQFDACFSAGFAVHSATVTGYGAGVVKGLWLGTHTGRAQISQSPRVDVRTEQVASTTRFVARIYAPCS